MSLLAKYALRTSDNLRQRLTAAFTDAARDIRNEATNTPNYANRRVWALWILKDAATAEVFAGQHQWRLLLNPTIAAAGDATTDGDLVFVVVSEIIPAVIPPAE